MFTSTFACFRGSRNAERLQLLRKVFPVCCWVETQTFCCV